MQESRGISGNNRVGGNCTRYDGTSSNRGSLAYVVHYDSCSANPTIGSDRDALMLRHGRNAAVRITRMLPRSAEDLHAGSDLGAFANGRQADYTICSYIYVRLNAHFRVREK